MNKQINDIPVQGTEVITEKDGQQAIKVETIAETETTADVKRPRRSGVQAKTLTAFSDTINRIGEDELLSEEEMEALRELQNKVRKNWIEKNL